MLNAFCSSNPALRRPALQTRLRPWLLHFLPRRSEWSRRVHRPRQTGFPDGRPVRLWARVQYDLRHHGDL